MSKKYAVIYLENGYSLRYSEFDADSVYDAVDNAFEIAYREAVQYDEIMDDLAENREWIMRLLLVSVILSSLNSSP